MNMTPTQFESPSSPLRFTAVADVNFWAWILVYAAFLASASLSNALEVGTALIGLAMIMMLPFSIGSMVHLNRPTYALWGLTLYTVFSLFWGVFLGNQFSDAFRASISLIFFIVVQASALNLSLDRLIFVLKFFVIIAAINSVKTWGLIYYSGFSVESILAGVRSTYVDPSSALPLVICAVPLIFVLFRSTPLKIFLLLAILSQIFASQSKVLISSVLICIIIAAVFLPGMSGRPGNRLISLSLVFRLAVLLIIATLAIDTAEDNPLLKRFLLATERPDQEFGGRLQEIANAWELFKSHPIFGTGLGAIFQHLNLELGQTFDYFGRRRYSHSVLFYHLAVFGFIGTIIVAWSFFGVLFRAGAWILKGEAFNRVVWAEGRPFTYQQLIFVVFLSELSMFFVFMATASFKNLQSLIVLAMLNAAGLLLFKHLGQSETENRLNS